MEIEVQPGAGCGCSGCFGTLFSGFVTVIVLVGVFGLLKGMTAASDEAAIEALNACPAVTDVLGSPVRERLWSVGCGESSSGGGAGDAQWTMSVAGPRGSATVRYRASYLGDSPWRIDAMEVSPGGGRVITAVPCPSAPEPERGRDRGGERDGKAKRGDGDGREGGHGDGHDGGRGDEDRDGKAKHKGR